MSPAPTEKPAKQPLPTLAETGKFNKFNNTHNHRIVSSRIHKLNSFTCLQRPPRAGIAGQRSECQLWLDIIDQKTFTFLRLSSQAQYGYRRTNGLKKFTFNVHTNIITLFFCVQPKTTILLLSSILHFVHKKSQNASFNIVYNKKSRTMRMLELYFLYSSTKIICLHCFLLATKVILSTIQSYMCK